MSSYFQRLLARSARPRAEIHPLARLPQSILSQPSLSEPELLGSHTELSSRPDRLEQSPTIEQNQRHESHDGPPNIAAASERLWPTASAELIEQPSVAMPQPAAAPPAAALVDEVVDVKHTAQPLMPTQVAAPETPLPGRAATQQQTLSAASPAFRLMPNQPQPGLQPKQHQAAAQDAATSLPALSVSPQLDITQARMQAAQLSNPAGQRTQHDKTEVHVSIGRIEVTAWPAPAPAKRAPIARSKAMSLDEYLRKRQQERA